MIALNFDYDLERRFDKNLYILELIEQYILNQNHKEIVLDNMNKNNEPVSFMFEVINNFIKLQKIRSFDEIQACLLTITKRIPNDIFIAEICNFLHDLEFGNIEENTKNTLLNEISLIIKKNFKEKFNFSIDEIIELYDEITNQMK